MPEFFRYRLAGPTRWAVEKFENEVMIRKGKRRLAGTACLSVHDGTLAIAVAYNLSGAVGLHGHDTIVEWGPSYLPRTKPNAQLLHSPTATFASGPFRPTRLQQQDRYREP